MTTQKGAKGLSSCGGCQPMMRKEGCIARLRLRTSSQATPTPTTAEAARGDDEGTLGKKEALTTGKNTSWLSGPGPKGAALVDAAGRRVSCGSVRGGPLTPQANRSPPRGHTQHCCTEQAKMSKRWKSKRWKEGRTSACRIAARCSGTAMRSKSLEAGASVPEASHKGARGLSVGSVFAAPRAALQRAEGAPAPGAGPVAAQ